MNKKVYRLQKKRIQITLMALPFVIFIIMFSYVPIFGWSFAFLNYRPGIPLSQTPFVGLRFFRLMIEYRAEIWRVLTNTLALAFLGLLVSVFPIIFAILLNELKMKRYKKLVQTVTTLPNFISWVIIYGLMFAIFSTEGLYNRVLMDFNLISRPTNVLGNANIVWFFQTGLGLWKGMGWSAIIYLAAMSGIDQELYSSAKVDGAGRFRCIWHITIPGIMTTYLVILLLSISSLLSVGFEQYFVFRNPMVMDKIEVLDLYVYRVGMVTRSFSFATAIGITKSIISIILLFTVNAISKIIRGYSII